MPAEPETSTDEVLRVRDVAVLLKIHEKDVYALVARGELPVVRLGTRLRFLRASVLQFLADRESAPRKRRLR